MKKKFYQNLLYPLFTIFSMILCMGIPANTMAQTIFAEDTATVVPSAKPADNTAVAPDITLNTDTGETNIPSVPSIEKPKADITNNDEALREAIMNCISNNDNEEIDLQFIDSAFHMRLSELNVHVSIQNIDSILRAEFKKVDEVENTPTVDYFVDVIKRSNSYNGNGSGLVKIEKVTAKADEEDGAIYDLSGQRLSAPPSHGIYIKNRKKILVK